MGPNTLFASAAILIGFVMIFLTAFTWIQQDRSAWPWPFRAMLTAATIWLVAYSFNFLSVLLPDKILLTRIQYVGIITVPVFWFLFSTYFVNQAHRVTRNVLISLFIIPFVSLVLMASNELHGWFWLDAGVNTDGGITYVDIEYGLWFWVHTAYSYIMLLMGALFMLIGVIRFSGRARWQALVLASSVIFPWVANILFLIGLNPLPAIDWTPFALSLSCVGFMVAIFGFDTTPWQSVAGPEEAGPTGE